MPQRHGLAVSRVKKSNLPHDFAGTAEVAAEEIRLQRVDDATALPRPGAVAESWVEKEYDELESEQSPLWGAEGVAASHSARVDAAGLAASAAGAKRRLDGNDVLLKATETRAFATTNALAPFRRRPPKAALWHYLTKTALYLGDTVGISSAAILLGELPILAVLMSISAAAATITAGLTGAELRDIRARRRRAVMVDLLVDEQKPFLHLFSQEDEGIRVVKTVIGASLTTALLIAFGIFSLRTTVEEVLVGVVFGAIAAAIAIASFVESYMYADEISDAINNTERDYAKALVRHARLAGDQYWSRYEKFAAEAQSLANENLARAEAAQAHVRALKWSVLRRNPGVAGHGTPEATVKVGRTRRQAVDR